MDFYAQNIHQPSPQIFPAPWATGLISSMAGLHESEYGSGLGGFRVALCCYIAQTRAENEHSLVLNKELLVTCNNWAFHSLYMYQVLMKATMKTLQVLGDLHQRIGGFKPDLRYSGNTVLPHVNFDSKNATNKSTCPTHQVLGHVGSRVSYMWPNDMKELWRWFRQSNQDI